MSSRKNKKKRSIRNIILNIVSTFLILLALALIFNSSIRNMIMVWNTNKYQVSKVTKKDIDKNKSSKGKFNFDKVEPLSTEAVLNAQWKAQQLPIIGGISAGRRERRESPRRPPVLRPQEQPLACFMASRFAFITDG